MQRSALLFFILTASLVATVYIALSYAPSIEISLLHIEIPILSFFFLSLFLFVCSLTTILLGVWHHGVLTGFLVIIYLLLRLYHLTSIFFLLLLLTIYLTLELFFEKQRDDE